MDGYHSKLDRTEERLSEQKDRSAACIQDQAREKK